ncbi:MAG: FxsA family protein [Porticoccus sp.]|nr:FxsA family protein [Porticoccus sp.]
MRYLLLVFVAMPIVEMWLLITIGREIGAWPTIGLVLLTAVVGFSLLRQQGFAMLFRVRQKIDAGELPAVEMVEAIILAVCGVLLVTPGFVTDVVGFAGLMPSLRRTVVSKMVSKVNVAGHGEEAIHHHHKPSDSGQSTSNSSDSEILEGEYWREDEEGSGRQ